MKKLSILIPTYNEEENVIPISERVTEIMTEFCPDYDYEIVFIDNDSKDNTRSLIREASGRNKRIKAIFNAKNFGQFNSPYYGLTVVDGDAAVLMAADFQDPPEMLPVFIREWEQGARIVSAIKTESLENPLMRFLRTIYYRLIRKLSDVDQIEHFTGFGLYDRAFLEVLKSLDDPTPFLRGIVAELGFRRKEVEYTQPKRKAGKTHNNFHTLYDAAMLSFTSYTKAGLRVATVTGFVFSFISILIAFFYLVLKLSNWDSFTGGTIPTLITVCVFGSVQMFFLGLLGEYILSMNKRIMKRPLVVEEERINF